MTALLVDLYELTMAASYLAEGVTGEATYELFFRALPPVRNYLVTCGLAQALDYLESLAFTDEDIAFLGSMFSEPFLEHLAQLRFMGDVWAVPEGEVVFAGEPVLRVTGPIIEAQIVETYLLNVINVATSIASKAARVATACAGRSFVDFSARRDHGPDAAMIAAWASFVGGASATSNVAAGARWGIPLSGTMAHSYVMAFAHEEEAFRAFARSFPASTLLIDTFDTLEGARRAAAVANEGLSVRGVRLDSGDIADLSRRVRDILDAAGQPEIRIFVSGDMDEYRIAALLAGGAPIDGFGVGTQLGTSGDAPALGGVYKLVEDRSGPKRKTSTGKETLPGVKQVYRLGDRDLIAPAGAVESGTPLLERVMAGGRRLRPDPPLPEIQQRCRQSVAALPSRLRSLGPAAPYPVEVSAAIRG